MAKKNLSKLFRCRLCQQTKPAGDTVKHVAYAGDSKHEQWRLGHGLPSVIPLGSLNQYEPKLRIAVASDFPQ